MPPDLSRFLPQPPPPTDPLLEFDPDPAGLRALVARHSEGMRTLTEYPPDEQRRLAVVFGPHSQKVQAALAWTPPPAPPSAAELEAARLASEYSGRYQVADFAVLAAASRAALEDEAKRSDNRDALKAVQSIRSEVVVGLLEQRASTPQQGPPVDALTLSPTELMALREQQKREFYR